MKNKLTRFVPYTIALLIVLFIYKGWFLTERIIGGDWPYYFPQTFSDFTFPPLSWVSWRGNGFGGIDIAYSLHIFEHFIVLNTKVFSIPWEVISRIFWFSGFLVLSALAINYLYNVIFPKNNSWEKALAIFLYLANTYILLVASGGQMGYALGYSVAPFILGLFIKNTTLTKKIQIAKNIIVTSLIFGFLLMVDIRIAYLMLVVVGVYLIVNLFFSHMSIKNVVTIALPVICAGLLNLSWILPLLLLKQNIVTEVSQAYGSVASLKFFSFAGLSHSVGLLHPNWPENIFGKVYFMKAEFIMLPVLAFSSLLFVISKKNKNNSLTQVNKFILFFNLIGLLGIFLAKGVNDPVGKLYIWLFEYIPGFVMFRDPTKWYVLIILSYSILIPFSVAKIYKFLSTKSNISIFHSKFNTKPKIVNLQNLFLFFMLCFLLFMVLPAFNGQLGGTFKRHVVPQEYIMLADYLDKQPEFFRTMWIPRQNRFSYSSLKHIATEGSVFFKATSSAQVIKELKKDDTQSKIEQVGIKYIIVPYDSLGEIFLKDRKYNKEEYEFIGKELRKISWLNEVEGFGNIIIFQTEKHNDHFYLTDKGILTYKQKNSTSYTVHVDSDKKNKIIFSENYNPYWKATALEKDIVIKKSSEGFMEFDVPQRGSIDINVSFTQQPYYQTGFFVSTILFLTLIVLYTMLKYTNLSDI